MNQEIKQTTTEQNPADARREAVVDSLVSLGSVWARYGLSVGRQALETSAKTLESTAKVLGAIAESMEIKREAERAATPAASVPAEPTTIDAPKSDG